RRQYVRFDVRLPGDRRAPAAGERRCWIQYVGAAEDAGCTAGGDQCTEPERRAQVTGGVPERIESGRQLCDCRQWTTQQRTASRPLPGGPSRCRPTVGLLQSFDKFHGRGLRSPPVSFGQIKTAPPAN